MSSFLKTMMMKTNKRRMTTTLTYLIDSFYLYIALNQSLKISTSPGFIVIVEEVSHIIGFDSSG
jgi:hypothetical protein